ncbi:MAG: hypothetical protein OEN52_02965 [Gammaproteobacteria bacterium]|nr:hypothetical protein [Gammaproteobacteria bacterium]MDH3559901.1 hypothetical protein [Gammaproteobacteria bacterium]
MDTPISAAISGNGNPPHQHDTGPGLSYGQGRAEPAQQFTNTAGIRTDCAADAGLAESLLTENDDDAGLLDPLLADMDGISCADTGR